jgi:TPR repeat protein
MDLDKAFTYYKLAADQGEQKAQFNIGLIYYNKKQFKDAYEYYKLSAHQGNVGAVAELGVMYYNGNGFEKDLEKSFEFFKIAAEQGNEKSKYQIGKMYQLGKGVNVDYDLALEYYDLKTKDLDDDHKYKCFYNTMLFGSPYENDNICIDFKDLHNKHIKPLIDIIKPNIDNITSCCNCNKEITKLNGESECSGCRTVAYCSRKCQKLNWNDHKQKCNEWGKIYFQLRLFMIYSYNKNEDDFYQFGKFFEYGTGIRKNSESARYWYNRALANKDDLD